MPPNEPEERLEAASRIADGAEVDWSMLGRPGGLGTADEAGYQVIQRVSEANRRLLDEPDTLEAEPTRDPDDPSSPDANSALATWGSLKLLERIGEGAFGEVYRAFDPKLNLEVALKLLRAGESIDERSENEFLREARRLARVRHPNVIVVHGADRRGGRLGLWTDLVRGETLESMIGTRGTLGHREATVIGIELCHALAAVHRSGLVHRDVKAANVMRQEGGRILLMDFGTAARLSPQGWTAGSGGLYGTPLTMAPEQLTGAPVSAAADLYSLGVLLYWLVTNAFPVEAQSIPELQRKHAAGERVPLRDRGPDLPEEFVQVVERCLDPDPERRYASAGALEQALRLAGPSPQPSMPTWVKVLATVSVLAIAAFVAWLVGWIPFPPEPHPSDMVAPTTSLAAAASLFQKAQNVDQPLQSGAHVAPGSRLSLRYECPETSYVYVLDEDAHGLSYVLFPVPGLVPTNPLPPGQSHRLPGFLKGEPADWQVTSAGGTESIMVIASRHPLKQLEYDLSRVPHAGPGVSITYPPLSPRADEELRGIGGVSVDTATASGTPKLSDALKKAAAGVSGPKDVWIWESRLSNPGPP